MNKIDASSGMYLNRLCDIIPDMEEKANDTEYLMGRIGGLPMPGNLPETALSKCKPPAWY